MGTSNLLSAAITGLNASPIVQPTTGEGAPGFLREVTGFVTTVAADAAGSTYRLVRLPSNAKVKSVVVEGAAMTAGKMNFSVYFSNGLNDGTQASNSGLIVPTTGNAFFASDVDFASAVVPTEVVNESGNYPISKRNMPLWQALGLASDPGGAFDIVGVVNTTAVTAAGLVAVSVRYVE